MTEVVVMDEDWKKRVERAEAERDEALRAQSALLVMLQDLRPALEATDEQPLVAHAWRVREERDALHAEVERQAETLKQYGDVWALKGAAESRAAASEDYARRAGEGLKEARAEARRLRAELEGESSASPPVGRCPKCGAAWYIDVGTCGCGL